MDTNCDSVMALTILTRGVPNSKYGKLLHTYLSESIFTMYIPLNVASGLLEYVTYLNNGQLPKLGGDELGQYWYSILGNRSVVDIIMDFHTWVEIHSLNDASSTRSIRRTHTPSSTTYGENNVN